MCRHRSEKLIVLNYAVIAFGQINEYISQYFDIGPVIQEDGNRIEDAGIFHRPVLERLGDEILDRPMSRRSSHVRRRKKV